MVIAVVLAMGLGSIPATGATSVVSPRTFAVPGQAVEGYWDDGAPVAGGTVTNTKLVALGGSLTSKMPHYRWQLLKVEGRTMPDLRVNPNTGTVYGSGPTIAPGTHRVWVMVRDAVGHWFKFWFPLSIRQCNSAGSPLEGTFAPCPQVAFEEYNTNRSGYLQPGKRGVEFTVALFAVGGQQPYRFVRTNGALPKGLTLNATYGIIHGTPKQAGSFPIEWRIVDAVGNTSGAAGTIVIRP